MQTFCMIMYETLSFLVETGSYVDKWVFRPYTIASSYGVL